jgi:hypothetical protein
MLMACAAITGLSNYSEEDVGFDGSEPDTGGAADVRPEAAPATDAVNLDDVSAVDADADAHAAHDADAQAGRVPDARAQRESGADSGTHGEGGDAEEEGAERDGGDGGDGGDGCACATPGCCAAGCQTVHSNGEGQSFYDCAALDTYDQTQAMEACTAFTGNSTQCTLSSTFCSSTSDSVCSAAALTCRCWQYSGPNPGTVQSPFLGCSAQCGASTDPKWN